MKEMKSKSVDGRDIISLASLLLSTTDHTHKIKKGIMCDQLKERSLEARRL